MHELLLAILLLPFLGFSINGIIYFLFPPNKKNVSNLGVWPGVIGFICVIIPFFLSLILFFLFDPTDSHIISIAEWMSAASFQVGFEYRLDALSIIMLLVVTGVGALIHLYSIEYMRRDSDIARFFCYLNLFIFSMTNLVLGENMLIIFLGWEGVGLCSYLLVSFWYNKTFQGVSINSTVDAGNKAFIINRIGDVGFVIAMFLLYSEANSLLISDFFVLDPSTKITTALILIFFACTGKSAQFPLYTWLPDAMAGPTPVSALIHAATMVTSGIFLMSRFSPLLVNSYEVSLLIAIVGIGTALIAATIALVQVDIKKILAYSTVSQLGFMFLAVGCGMYHIAIFHVITHAFFKACLFLGSGSVIHAVGGKQDIRLLGGLIRKMPVTAITFLVSSLALAGFPLTSGFFSKDSILASSLLISGFSFYTIGILTAFITALYTTRLYCHVFLGKHQSDVSEKAKESSLIMTVPLAILGIFSLIGGVIGLPSILSESNFIEKWLTSQSITSLSPNISHLLEWILFGISALCSISGITLGIYIWHKKQSRDVSISSNLFSKNLSNLLFNKYYLDEIYNNVFVRGIVKGLHIIAVSFDYLLTILTRSVYVPFLGLGMIHNYFQNGNTQAYATLIVLGVLGMIWFLLF